MTKYIVSTMTAPVNYCVYDKQEEFDSPVAGIPRLRKVPIIRKKIRVNGGANIPSMKSGFGEQSQSKNGMQLWTPSGTITAVSDEDFDLLMQNPVFLKHLDKNLVKPISRDIVGDYKSVSKEASTMTKKDDFAQLDNKTLAERYKLATNVNSMEGDNGIEMKRL